MSSSEFYEILAKDLSKLLEEYQDHDMIIVVGEEPNIKTFYVHSNILRVRSNYFKTFLSANWIRREDDKIRFSKPNIDPEVFAIILEYIYGGKIKFQEDLDPLIIFDCIKAADELGILEFLFYSQDYLLSNKITWLKENLVLIYRDSFGLDSMRKLQEFSVDRIKKYPYLFFDSDDFHTISGQALITIIKDDKLEMEEIEIWNKLIKWGIANTSSNNISDITISNYNNISVEYSTALGMTLKNYIKHIRFHNMNINEINNVLQYKEILGAEYDNILEYFPNINNIDDIDNINNINNIKSSNILNGSKEESTNKRKTTMKKKLPNRGAAISTIMSSGDAAIIASWIDRKDIFNSQEGNIGNNNEFNENRNNRDNNNDNNINNNDNNNNNINNNENNINNDDREHSEHVFKPYSRSEIPYEFKLLVRGSRDGFSVKKFHSECDGKRSTISLFKLQDYDIFVGGYNPDVWHNTLWPQYKKNDKAFIFSFTQGNDANNIINNNNCNNYQGKVARLRVENYGYALNCWRSSGPSFGKFDLLMQNGTLRFKHKTYVPNVMPFDDKFVKIDDYEVFQVIMKETMKNGAEV
ncbi:hypothetical protein Glove_621g55 [Diversispora epigaea]|uniref:BTB domain-containing protein n=1 Tax=Diversispora epigaea TaxID=1348612 RepID=A0A397GBU2_9GLOM|nr:hypothetical protein Glove_621g55 [Diversispora epigaea]